MLTVTAHVGMLGRGGATLFGRGIGDQLSDDGSYGPLSTDNPVSTDARPVRTTAPSWVLAVLPARDAVPAEPREQLRWLAAVALSLLASCSVTNPPQPCAPVPPHGAAMRAEPLAPPTDRQGCQFVFSPTFAPAHAVWTEDGGDTRVSAHASLVLADGTTEDRSLVIDDRIAGAIDSVCGRAARVLRDTCQRPGRDGVWVHLVHRRSIDEAVEAWIWSPPPATLESWIVEVGAALRDYVVAPVQYRSIQGWRLLEATYWADFWLNSSARSRVGPRCPGRGLASLSSMPCCGGRASETPCAHFLR